jgi:hypothetical protein
MFASSPSQGLLLKVLRTSRVSIQPSLLLRQWCSALPRMDMSSCVSNVLFDLFPHGITYGKSQSKSCKLKRNCSVMHPAWTLALIVESAYVTCSIVSRFGILWNLIFFYKDYAYPFTMQCNAHLSSYVDLVWAAERLRYFRSTTRTE